MPTITAWGNTEAGAALSRHTLTVADPGPDELLLEVLYCGLCHSDLGHIDEPRPGTDPLVGTGPETVARVVATGDGGHLCPPRQGCGCGLVRASCPACSLVPVHLAPL